MTASENPLIQANYVKSGGESCREEHRFTSSNIER